MGHGPKALPMPLPFSVVLIIPGSRFGHGIQSSGDGGPAKGPVVAWSRHLEWDQAHDQG